MPDAANVFTIGHSNRPLDDFIALLRDTRIACVVDVRRFPGSRAMPQYDGDALRQSLSTAGVDYVHMPVLGGRRERAPRGDARNALWENPGFRAYADYALTAPFRAALRELEARLHRQRCALMCAEAAWWRCHRRIITDYLLVAGFRVVHILAPGTLHDAVVLTPGAQPTAAGIVYPSPQGSLL
jgi:uncharacterized protein (DUF488 family)